MPNVKNYVLLETITVGAAGASSVTFNNIPQTGYTDLKIVASARTTRSAAGSDWVKVSFNGVTTNLSMRLLYGEASSTGSYTDTAIYGATGSNSQTASTFGNAEIYIPNYAGSTNKSVSIDAVSENNSSTGNYLSLTAGLWSSTAAITSITLTPYTGPNWAQYSTFSLYGLAAVGTTPTIAPKATGGDIIQTDGTYWYHAFLSSGSFVPSKNLVADALVIGAGGGGGSDVGGGGGAGRVYGLSNLNFVSATSYTCTVGAGGAGNSGPNAGLKGNDSTLIGGLLSYSSLGGGGGQGRSYGTAALNNGWSGGGSSYNSDRPATAGNGGFAGGTTNGYSTNPSYCGGGGGTTSAGTNSTNGGTSGGAGTSTYSSWASATGTGVGGAYAGGGGGGNYGVGGYRSYGQAGGGYGSYDDAAQSATANTGSGGGGGGSSQVSGNGGSGIVIIRYPVA